MGSINIGGVRGIQVFAPSNPVAQNTAVVDFFDADSGLWLDGALAAAALTISSGRARWTQTGTQRHTSANAASDPNANEANATTGWATVMGTLTSDAVAPHTGTYSLKFVPNGNPNGRMYWTPGSSYAGKWIRATLQAKGGAGSIARNLSSAYTLSQNIATDWAQHVFALFSDSDYYLEGPVSVTETAYFDNVSILELTQSTMFRVRRIYYPSTVSVKIRRTLGAAKGVALYKDSSNYVVAFMNGGNVVHLRKKVAGIYSTILASGAITYADDATLELIPNAAFTAFSVKYAGVEVIASTAITDFAVSGTWHAGMLNTYDSANDTFDDFLATKVVGAAAFLA